MSYGLIVTRKSGEAIMIGNDIRVTLLSINRNTAQISIKAPSDVVVLREELIEFGGDLEPVQTAQPT